MYKFLKNSSLFIVGLALCFIMVSSVCAQTAKTSTSSKVKKASTESISTVINRANDEIDQRIESLNNLIVRLNLIKKISSTQQSSLLLTVRNEIAQLTTLKTKIDFDTSLPTAKTDYDSITKSYRTYALILPQVRTIAAADRALTVVVSMNIVGSKVQSRISTLTGINAGPINKIFSDFTAKIGDAGTQANLAIKTVYGLQPDQGSDAKMQENNTAIKSARLNIKNATNDLIVARKDLGTIITDLAEMGDVTGAANSVPATVAPSGQ